MSSSSSSHRVHTAVVLRSHRLGLTSDRGRRGPLGELSDEGRSSAEAARNRRISMKTATHACETGAFGGCPAMLVVQRHAALLIQKLIISF